MAHTVKCKIVMYDPAVTEPPLKFIELGECEIIDTDRESDYLGEERFRRLFKAVKEKGYAFKSYSLCSKTGYKYTITVFDPDRF